jgi:hypothetical protein
MEPTVSHTVRNQPLNQYEHAFLKVRRAWHASDGSMAARAVVTKEAACIRREARQAGAQLDELALDERARREAGR